MLLFKKWRDYFPPIHIIVYLELVTMASSYLILVPNTFEEGSVIFESKLPRLGRERLYKYNTHKNAEFVQKLIKVDEKTGQVELKKKLDCRGIWYPNLFTLHIDSYLLFRDTNRRNTRSKREYFWNFYKNLRSESLTKVKNDKGVFGVEYYSLPLRILVTGNECDEDVIRESYLDAHDEDLFQMRTNVRLSVAKKWVPESFASFAMPSDTDYIKICLRKSQFVNSLSAFLPSTVLSEKCSVKYLDVNDRRFEVETSVGDLVSATDQCIHEPMWKISVMLEITCQPKTGIVSPMEHRLKIVYHHQYLNDTDIARRVRRELKNQSPYFEQALYVASVPEEKSAGVVVATLRARDPESSPLTYSMTSLLDQRSQGMLTIDPTSGVVTTLTKLDRELLDVHYLRVVATDDSFPPHSGTTTLQVNVVDENDHTPVFENDHYEASVREGVTVGTVVVTVRATDQDVGRHSEIEYGLEGEKNDMFHIDTKQGIISTRQTLDRETMSKYKLRVTATDQGSVNERRTAEATLDINVTDDNDNYPQFTERAYTVTVPEDFDYATDPLVASVKATDADEGQNAAIRYAIIGGNMQAQFSIDSLTGDVFLSKPLDYEVLKSFRLVIRAQDGGNPARSNTTQLLVNVKDVNDNAPRFYTSLFQESVVESVPVGYSIVRVQAYDADEGSNSVLKYSLSERDDVGTLIEKLPITIDPTTGWIHTTRELDREQTHKYQFQVIAEDSGEPAKSVTASVVITVQDVNDNDPVFLKKNYEVVVSEVDPPGTLVTTLSASDPDENPRLHYEITNGNNRGRFSITSQNNKGILTISQALDYRQEKRFILTVTATDVGGRSDTATVYINVTDANNYSPVFENAPYNGQVFEDAPVGTTVLVVQASDSDVGQNALITYTLGSNNENDIDSFSINPQTGAILTTRPLDREVTGGYLLTVTARDGGVPSLSDTTDVEIVVQDVNDNAPVFSSSSYSGVVSEDALIGTSVVQVQATDVDMELNGRVRYSFSPPGSDVVDSNSFVIDPSSGVIRTSKTLDRESVASYQLHVYAIDRGSPALSSSVIVNIKVDDVNDSPPTFDSEKLVMYIAENSPIGSTVGEIRAKDPDEGVNAVVQYSVIGGDDSSSFSLVTRPGWDKAELLTNVELDYESDRKKYELIVRAASPPLRNDVRVEIIVTDVNDNAPVLKDFQVIFNNYRDCFPNGPIGQIPAFDADVSDELRYRILSGNNANLILMNESTGELTLSPQLNTNVPKLAAMDVSVTDGVNQVKVTMTLSIRLITEEMLFNSVTVRLNDMTEKAFLSPLLGFFVDALAAIIPCPREYVYLFSVQDDTDVHNKILNVSFSARRPDVNHEEYYTPQYLQERVYLNRAILARLSTVQVLPFDDNLCVREPCLNYEHCLTVLKFGNATGFVSSDTVLFRPIYPVTTFACRCPAGFTGSREHYLCDTEVDLCYSNPCQNHGKCKRREGGYSCICRNGYTGINCEIDLNSDTCQSNICNTGSCRPNTNSVGFQCDCDGTGVIAPKTPHGTSQIPVKKKKQHSFAMELSESNPLCQLRSRGFSRSSFLTFNSLKQRHRLHIKLRFATQAENGLLLYNGRYNEKHDFIAVEVIHGAVQVSFSLGTNVSRTTASVPGGVSDGNWHSVIVAYFNKTVTISVDECDVLLALNKGSELGEQWNCANKTSQVLDDKCALFTETCHRFLDLTGPLQIGGLPSLPTDFQVQSKDFEGCIADLHIDHVFMDLNSYVADNGTHPGCIHKKQFCSSNPCQHGGKCTEAWGTYLCQCRDGWGSKDCSQVVKVSWRFRGDGTLSFNPLLKPIQLPWINSLSVRTVQKDAFLMSVQVGQNSTASMSLKNGYLQYSFNGEVATMPQGYVADGNWHYLEMKWMSNEVWLSYDYGQREYTKVFHNKVQGLYVGKILIGGPDSSYPSLHTDYGYLDGCIQEVKVGSDKAYLERPTVESNVAEGCSGSNPCSVLDKCPSRSVCMDQWEYSTCQCRPGYVGQQCLPVCTYEPCLNDGRCVEDTRSERRYSCQCNDERYSGDYCETPIDQPCPSSWWGYPVCGPCHCNTELGYNPDCNKTTGECYCSENHYQPSGSERCLPCDCYAVGSFNVKCDYETGQCKCRNGVIGRRCDSCSHPYAEVTLRGCEVVYDGCPRSFSEGLWWDRTQFGESALASCPTGSVGKASRLCDSLQSHWSSPDLFNCTSNRFLDLRKVLSQLENDELKVNTFVAVKVANDLSKATNLTKKLHGSDLLITHSLLTRLIEYELQLYGLNLTHSQDKDYIQNLVTAVSVVLNVQYIDHWRRVEELTQSGPVSMVTTINKYLNTLVESQDDTYTTPFEIVTSNVVIGLDVVTTQSLFGYESSANDANSLGKETVVLPDTSLFLHPALGVAVSTSRRHEVVEDSPTLQFPKYNNYLQDKNHFDQHSKVLIPLHLLGIKPFKQGDTHQVNRRSVISYVQYKQAGQLFPDVFDETVTKRWGVQLKVGSIIASFAVLVPSTTTNSETGEANEVTYTSLSDVHLSSPVRVRLWLEPETEPLKASPQCVHWSTARGSGEWSRSGCITELPDIYNPLEPYLVNCTCYHLSTFAVLVDIVDVDYIPEPTFLEDLVTYIGFSISIPLLLIALLILTCIRGTPTNSNSIHKNIILCILLGEIIYFAALKLRRSMIQLEFPCKMTAMLLHYLWLCAFSWTLVDSIHLHRMLTELRDINHGEMRFYYSLGYVLPAVIVSLSVGVRADQYGNFYFCWLSIYESVVWSLVGPVCLSVCVTLIVLALVVRAAFTLKDHVLGYGNLRTLVWVSVVFLPLLGIVWVLLVLSVSEPLPLLPPALCLSLIVHSGFVLAGFCFVNARVRRNLHISLLKCCGREIPKELDLSVDEVRSSSNLPSDRQAAITRSALAYRNTGVTVSVRRNMGISTSSTTSRSTAKTSSSPYRSDTHLRGTDTSTSNYNSNSELPSYIRTNNGSSDIREEGSRSRESDSDSDNSGGRSLELASSHSSDDDESSRHHRSLTGKSSTQSYLPNIREGVVPVPPTLNVISQSELFPNLAPLYAPRWSSQMPQSYHSGNLGDLREEETSPQPLPNPDNTDLVDYPSDPHKLTHLETPVYQVNLATVYEHKIENYNTDIGDCDDKLNMGDKYLFPYTAEEDHCSSVPSPQVRFPSRRDSPVYGTHVRDSPQLTVQHRVSPQQPYQYYTSPSDSPQYQRSSPLFANPRNSPLVSTNHPPPFLMSSTNQNVDNVISESEKDMSETPV